MKYVQAKGLDLSAFALGTVQLGIEYGLGEHSAKPTEEAAFAILDRAVDLGVNTLDTANNYGESEAVIGRWLTKRRAEGKKLPYIVTKVGPLKHGSYDMLRDDALLYKKRLEDQGVPVKWYHVEDGFHGRRDGNYPRLAKCSRGNMRPRLRKLPCRHQGEATPDKRKN